MPISTVSLGYLCTARRNQGITCCVPRVAMGICASITLSLWNKYRVDIMVFCAVGGNYREAFKLLSTELVMGVLIHCRGSLTLPVCSPSLSGGSCGTGAQGWICSFGCLPCPLPTHWALSQQSSDSQLMSVCVGVPRKETSPCLITVLLWLADWSTWG